ncbi:MAG: LolA-related protein [Rubrivivax sp.]|nr:LolA-related protein [Rubrivivax sp.]
MASIDWGRRLLLALPIAWMAAAPLQALAFNLPELMDLLAQRRSGEAHFTEERFVQGLDKPLASSGQISFTAPNRFARTTLKPRLESMTVEGASVTVERAGRARQFSLDAVPEMGAIITAVRGTLTGNADALRESFVPAVIGNAAAWTLTLTPREQRLLSVIKQMRIDGRQSEMRRVEVQLADGDRSVMTIEAQAQAAPPRAAAP